VGSRRSSACRSSLTARSIVVRCSLDLSWLSAGRRAPDRVTVASGLGRAAQACHPSVYYDR
jgi:hypothetical protein